MFGLVWGPTLAAVSVVLDNASDGGAVRRALDCLLLAARMAAFHQARGQGAAALGGLGPSAGFRSGFAVHVGYRVSCSSAAQAPQACRLPQPPPRPPASQTLFGARVISPRDGPTPLNLPCRWTRWLTPSWSRCPGLAPCWRRPGAWRPLASRTRPAPRWRPCLPSPTGEEGHASGMAAAPPAPNSKHALPVAPQRSHGRRMPCHAVLPVPRNVLHPPGMRLPPQVWRLAAQRVAQRAGRGAAPAPAGPAAHRGDLRQGRPGATPWATPAARLPSCSAPLPSTKPAAAFAPPAATQAALSAPLHLHPHQPQPRPRSAPIPAGDGEEPEEARLRWPRPQSISKAKGSSGSLFSRAFTSLISIEGSDPATAEQVGAARATGLRWALRGRA